MKPSPRLTRASSPDSTSLSVWNIASVLASCARTSVAASRYAPRMKKRVTSTSPCDRRDAAMPSTRNSVVAAAPVTTVGPGPQRSAAPSSTKTKKTKNGLPGPRVKHGDDGRRGHVDHVQRGPPRQHEQRPPLQRGEHECREDRVGDQDAVRGRFEERGLARIEIRDHGGDRREDESRAREDALDGEPVFAQRRTVGLPPVCPGLAGEHDIKRLGAYPQAYGVTVELATPRRY